MAWCSTFVRVTHQNVVSITDTHVIPPFFRLLLLALYNDRASAAAAQNRTSRRRLQAYMIWDHPCPEKHSGVAIDACRNNTGPSGISVGSGGIERHSGRPPAGTALGVGGLLGERNRSNSFDCNAFVAPRCLNAAETSEPNDRTFADPSPTRNPEGSNHKTGTDPTPWLDQPVSRCGGSEPEPAHRGPCRSAPPPWPRWPRLVRCRCRNHRRSWPNAAHRRPR
jgi:hypothetical protein